MSTKVSLTQAIHNFQYATNEARWLQFAHVMARLNEDCDNYEDEIIEMWEYATPEEYSIFNDVLRSFGYFERSAWHLLQFFQDSDAKYEQDNPCILTVLQVAEEHGVELSELSAEKVIVIARRYNEYQEDNEEILSLLKAEGVPED